MPVLLKDKITYLRDHWFVRNTALLQVGSFLGTITQALAGVLMARLLQPERFGIYTLAFSVASLASFFIGAGIQEVVLTLLSSAYAKGSREDIKKSFAFFIKISVLMGLVGLILALIAPSFTGLLYHNYQVGQFALFVIIASTLSSLFFAFSAVSLQVTGKIRSFTFLTMSDQVIRFSCSLILVYLGGGIWGAVVGQLIGASIIALISIGVWHALILREPHFPSYTEIFAAFPQVHLREYLRFTSLVIIDRNLGTLYGVLPVLLTGIFLLPSEVTYFKLAFGYINIALSLLGPISVLLNVEFPRLQIQNKEKLLSVFYRVTGYSLLLSLFLTVGAIIIAPFMFRILYGTTFLKSVPYVAALFFYGALFGLGVGLGPMWRAIKKVHISVGISSITLLVGVPIGFVLIRTFGGWGSVAMVTLWYTVAHACSYAYIVKELRRIELKSFFG